VTISTRDFNSRL